MKVCVVSPFDHPVMQIGHDPTRPKGSTAKVPVPSTTGRPQGYAVHVLRGSDPFLWQERDE